LRRTEWERAMDVGPGEAGWRGEGQERGERQQGCVKRIRKAWERVCERASNGLEMGVKGLWKQLEMDLQQASNEFERSEK